MKATTEARVSSKAPKAVLTWIFTEPYYHIFSLFVLTFNLLHADVSQEVAGTNQKGVQ